MVPQVFCVGSWISAPVSLSRVSTVLAMVWCECFFGVFGKENIENTKVSLCFLYRTTGCPEKNWLDGKKLGLHYDFFHMLGFSEFLFLGFEEIIKGFTSTFTCKER